MKISERVAAGVASDEEVALLCGREKRRGLDTHWSAGDGTCDVSPSWYWVNSGDQRQYAPVFTTDIRATMAEIERRGWKDWFVGNDSLHGIEAAVWAGHRYVGGKREKTCHQGYHDNSPATALLIALTRAIEASKTEGTDR